MDLEQKVKESINTFNDARFLMLLSESEALVQNIHNLSTYSLPFKIKNSVLLFEGAMAEKKGDPDEEEEMEEEEEEELEEDFLEEDEYDNYYTPDLIKYEITECFKNFFESDEDLKEFAIARAKTLIEEELHYVEKDDEEDMEDDEDEPMDEDEDETSSYKKDSKMEEFFESLHEFSLEGNLFDEDGEIKNETMVDPIVLAESLKEKQQYFKTFFENAEELNRVVSRISNIIGDEDILEEAYKNVNFLESNFANKILANLAKLKAKGLYFENLVTVTKQINQTVQDIEDIISESSLTAVMPSQSIYNQIPDKPAFKFLKYKTGIYGYDDTKCLEQELQTVLRDTYNMTEEEMNFVNDCLTKISYMNRTNQIDDGTVATVISSFNQKFGRNPETYNNTMLGWKSQSAQMAAGAGYVD